MSLEPLDRTFNLLQDCQWFEEYVSGLREELRDPSQAPPLTTHPNLYQLRQTTRREPMQWLHLRMVAPNNAQIIVWIRTDNLYVVGFEQEQGPRYEFGIDPNNDRNKQKKKDKEKKAKRKREKEEQEQQERRPLIPGSTFLGFGGGYDDLGQLLSCPEPEPGRPMQYLGWQAVEAAIHGLAAYTPEAPGQVRQWLRTIVITISESLRLHNVCRHIAGLLSGYTKGWLTQRMIDCIKNWDSLSSCVIASAAAPEGDAHGLYRYLSHICDNTDQACDVVAILNTGAAADEQQPGPSRRPKREAAAGDGDDVPVRPLGLTFVEIFSAVVQGGSSSMGGNRNRLYGHIAIDDGLSSGSSQLLFMRGRSNALPTSSDGQVQLTDPARAVWGYGEVVMRVDLMDAAIPVVADMTPDGAEEVGSGKLVWNTYDTPRLVYNEAEEYVFEGVSGAINVRCAVVTNAVVATVVLRRSGTGSGQKVDVYGTVSAATAMFGPQDKVTLFNREWKDAVSVGAGEDVPLLRKIAIVPLGSPLTICADLWTRAYDADMSADDRISSGAVAVFHPRPFGFETTRHGDVEVFVTWSLN